MRVGTDGGKKLDVEIEFGGFSRDILLGKANGRHPLRAGCPEHIVSTDVIEGSEKATG